jgi:hypothetical protein
MPQDPPPPRRETEEPVPGPGAIPLSDTSPGPESPGKRSGAAAAIIVVVIIVIIATAFVLLQPGGYTNTTPVTTPVPTSPLTLSTSLPTVATALPTTIATLPPTPDIPVAFLLETGEPASCGLTCRELDATITNTGYATAHDVCITLVIVNSYDEVILINGADSLTQCIGDLPGGASKTEHVVINADCGSWGSKCLGQTLTLQTWVSSEELDGSFPDRIMMV